MTLDAAAELAAAHPPKPPDPDDEPEIIDLAEIARIGDGAAWSQRSDDLSAELVVLDLGTGLAEHVERERDLLLIGVLGEGALTIDGRLSFIWPGAALLIPKGARRAIQPTTNRFAYLACASGGT